MHLEFYQGGLVITPEGEVNLIWMYFVVSFVKTFLTEVARLRIIFALLNCGLILFQR